MKVLLGGTFSVLHKAHRTMILRGASLGDLYIGLTSDKFVINKNYKVPDYQTREKQLKLFLQENQIKANVSVLDDPYGKTLDKEFDAIVVSNETLDFVRGINLRRKSMGIRPLLVENIGTLLAEDLMPIKSERIIKGYIDGNGKRLKKIILGVASDNPEKIKGTEMFAKRFFKDFKIEIFQNNIIDTQPFNNEIFESANKRLSLINKEVDYAIATEAGVFKIGESMYDIHYTLIRDRLGSTITGISSALPLNERIVEQLKGGNNFEEITDKIAGVKNSGENKGAVYYLSEGIKERYELVYESILSAFIQRLSQRVPFKFSDD